MSTAPRKVETIDLNATTREVLDAIRPALNDRGAHVDVSLLPTVEGERGQISQLLQNLILNAVKFTDDDVAPEVEVSARPVHDGRWEIRVADNGVGIAPDQAKRIFEMFQRGTSDRARSGTRHRPGAVRAASSSATGATSGSSRARRGGSAFAFDLPGAPGAPSPAPRSEERVLAG